jgi:hypothetical protein
VKGLLDKTILEIRRAFHAHIEQLRNWHFCCPASCGLGQHISHKKKGRSNMRFRMLVTVAFTVLCLTSLAYAKDKDKETINAPEIDVGMAGSAITVLVGALSLFHERRRKESS